jgi:hypothetical protein
MKKILTVAIMLAAAHHAGAQYTFTDGLNPDKPGQPETSEPVPDYQPNGMPTYGTTPEGNRCVNTFPFFCPAGSTYPDGSVQPGGESEGGGGEGSESKPPAETGDGGLPAHGIDPDGKPCVNTFPWFCPPGSTYPDGAGGPGSTGDGGLQGDGSGAATQEDLDRVARDYGASMLGGDEKLACEALLCLAAATVPPECRPSLSKYFSIVLKTISKTIRARQDFLNLCPVSKDEGMPGLIAVISNGAGQCDLESLNRPVNPGRDEAPYVSDGMPSACAAYYSHPMIQQTPPRYVGKPSEGGFWVAADEYDAALARYLEEQRARKEREQNDPATNAGGS